MADFLAFGLLCAFVVTLLERTVFGGRMIGAFGFAAGVVIALVIGLAFSAAFALLIAPAIEAWR